MSDDSPVTGARSPLSGKKIVLGITGGIAAYKAAYLTRILKGEGVDVWVCMTASATRFITPLTMETLSEREVLREMFPEDRMVGTRHITIAEWADAFVIAPATANILAKLRAGIADDLLSTLLVSTEAPVFVAPAMNTRMYDHPATQENLRALAARGVRFIDPGVGDLACRTVGVGRMAEPDEIVAVVRRFFRRAGDLAGRTVIVTAGPTREPLDPVRFLSNRSSGKMGYRLAEQARDRGAGVILVSGPTALPNPAGVETIRVETAAEMKAAVEARFAEAHAVIMAAAVADFRPGKQSQRKIKKSAIGRSLAIAPTPDILDSLGKKKTHQVLVGFALETGNLIKEASRKLREKYLDLIVANDPTVPGAGFDVDTNDAVILSRDREPTPTGLVTKRRLAEMIVDRIVALVRSAKVGARHRKTR